MDPTDALQGRRIALLIDFDNVILGVEDPGFDVELVVNALRSRGVVVLGRAYGDWYRHNRHRRKLMEQGIELVETPVFGPLIKNSADIRIALDGFEIAMTQPHIDTFCLISGDSDFLPLIKKLQYLNKTVLVIAGNRFTSDLVRRNCNEYISYENLLAESLGATEDASTLEGAFALVRRSISNLQDRGAEVRSSTVKQMMLQLNPMFNERNFACPQFKQFLDKASRAGVIKLGGRDPSSGEYGVLLCDEEAETPASAAAPAEARPAPRRRGGRERAPAPAPAAEAPRIETAVPAEEPSADGAATPVAAEEAPRRGRASSRVAGDGHAAPAERNLRRGRLRFSGRSFREQQTAQQGGEIPAEPVAPQEPAAPPEPVSTDQLTWTTVAPPASEAPATEAATPTATESGEAPRRRTRRGGRSRSHAAEGTVTETEAAAPAPAEAEPAATEAKKPATRRRRSPATKKTAAKKSE